MSRLGWNLVIMKTKHEKNSETAKALRLAESKVNTCERVSASDEKLAHAAKVRFKSAKKAWKLARKKAKRSAKLAKLANKNLAALSKHVKKIKKQPQPAKARAKTPTALAKKSTRSIRPVAVSAQSAPVKPAGDSGSNPAGDTIVT